MKKIKVFMTVLPVVFSLLISSCGFESLKTGPVSKGEASLELSVMTMYAGSDGNASNFKAAVKEWEDKTGCTVKDSSVTSDETFKTRVSMDFLAGAEADVLFYFSGEDAANLVKNNRVVSIDEIREVYPEYASNMKESLLQPSPVDGRIYSIPVNGYWEGLFVNKKVCEAAGVEVPDENTDWDTFMETCEKIKEAGYTPIAASLAGVPHYWFEFCIYNFGTYETHATVPRGIYDRAGIAWSKGLSDIKMMYEKGYFPDNTLSASDDETMHAFLEGRAAFLLDGSWRVSAIENAASNVDDFIVTFVPGKNDRKSTDILGGLSSGYYISRKAWEDPEKREAAVSFVEFMTTDDMVSRFAYVSATALKSGVKLEKDDVSGLVKSALYMAEHASGVSEAVQDYVPAESRAPIFEKMPDIVKGNKDIDEAIGEVINCLK
ncbi:MAG: extracellular solute-binding protein [Lachnospiraceae bacterium]|nr:extracellular solute-binding protein [Lachnospiraceae bacterium]